MPMPVLYPEIRIAVKATPKYPRQSEASLCELADGRLLMAWIEFEVAQDNGLAHIAAMTSDDGGRTWDNHRILVGPGEGDLNVFSPNLLRLPDGRILFLFFRYHTLDDNVIPSTSAFICESSDEGATFSEPRTLWNNDTTGFASHILKRLSTGRLLLPVTRQMGLVWSPTDHVVVGCATSDDNGRTWRMPEHWTDLPLRGCMEPHVEELRDGRVFMVMRTQLGSVFKAHSCDGGETWSKPQTTGLRSPESCPELTRLSEDGGLLLVWNQGEYDMAHGHFGKRTPLTVAVSQDDGETWSHIKNIETDPNGCYSNPACMVLSNGQAILTYWATVYTPEGEMSASSMDLKSAIFPVTWLTE